MDKPIETIQTKSDSELLEEYENRLINDMAEDGIPYDEMDKKRILH